MIISRKTHITLFCVLLIMGLQTALLYALAQDVSFSASAPNVVKAGEQFRLNFVVNASPSSFDAPDLSDFYVISGPNQSTSRSFQIINGRSTSSVTITYTYYLQATREGNFTIDPARVTVNGTEYRSNQVEIEIIAGEHSGQGKQPARPDPQSSGQIPESDVSEELFVRIHTDRNSIFLGEHLIVTIKIYTRLPITGFGESEMPDFDGFWTQEIEAPSQVNLIRENINGRIFNTGMIKKMILFPQKTGEIKISPFRLETYIRQKVQRPQSIFDDFFGSSYTNVLKNLESNPVSIRVKALPAGAPDDFLGLAGNIALEAEVDQLEIETNDALTYKIQISGTGNIQLAEAPIVNFPPDFESYDPKIQTLVNNSENGQSGRKTFEYLLIPRHAGNYRIPPVSLSYFDIRSGQYKTLTTEEFNLAVAEGPDEETVSVITGRSKEDLRIIGSDILFIKDHAFRLRKIGGGLFGTTEFIMLYVVALVLFFAVLLIRRNRIKKLQNEALLKNRRASREARKRLKAASALLKKEKTEDAEEAFYESLLRALEGYLADKLSIPRSELSREAVRKGLFTCKVSGELIDNYLELTDQCEAAKYAPGSHREKMEDLYLKSVKAISQMEQNLRK